MSKAEQRFGAYPFVRYQLLDIERDPLEQGFGLHQFDVILAANVLHATTRSASDIAPCPRAASAGRVDGVAGEHASAAMGGPHIRTDRGVVEVCRHGFTAIVPLTVAAQVARFGAGVRIYRMCGDTG